LGKFFFSKRIKKKNKKNVIRNDGKFMDRNKEFLIIVKMNFDLIDKNMKNIEKGFKKKKIFFNFFNCIYLNK